METAPRRPFRLLRLAGKLALSALVFLVLLLVIEGGASVYLLVSRLSADGVSLAEHKHTTYDELLGWVNEPGVSLPDMYGPGIGLHTNSMGFRDRRELSREVPPGKVRLVCTGDSFTLAYGVGDEETWASVLEELDPRLETVNMGQGGYGVDQAFLWYRRDGVKVEHDLHVFAFITGDFLRARRSHNYGLPKPVLRVEGGKLAVEGTPVSRWPYRFSFLAHNRDIVAELRTLQAAGTKKRGKHQAHTEESYRAVTLAMFDELVKLNEERGSRLVVLHLPMKSDAERGATEFERFLERALAQKGVPYLNLLEELRQVPSEDLDALFIRPEDMDYPGAAGHFTVSGNRWAAERVLALLTDDPAFTDAVGALADTPR